MGWVVDTSYTNLFLYDILFYTDQMELAIPLLALSGLYVMSKQGSSSSSSEEKESFTTSKLPNTDVPDVNYPPDESIRTEMWDRTSNLINNNRYDGGGVYTDKFFNPAVNTTSRISSVADDPSTSDMRAKSSTQSSQFYSMTGERVDLDYFQHNNMTPYFGGHLRNKITSANSNESQLDAMNGTGSQYLSKRENAPLFAPETNLEWALGMPNNTDFVRSRMNVGMRMANVNPFKEEKVGPGLGLGYTSAGQGGFNAGMAMRDSWLDRGVDELRVATKPKASGMVALGYEGPANSYIKTLAGTEQMGIVEKNRPDTSFAMSHDRLMTTTGVEKGQTLRSIPIDRYVSRPETAISYAGGAGYTNTTKEMVYGEYMPSHNHALGEVPVPVANANGRGYGTDADYGIKASQVYANNRSENDQGEYFGGLGGTIGAVVAPLLDMLRPSRRENTIGTLRPYQNPGSTVSQSYYFNPADRAPITIRETTERSIGHLNTDKTLYERGAYEVTPVEVKDTIRQATSTYYSGSASNRTKEARTYDAEYSQRNNENKSSTVEQTAYMTKGGLGLLNGDINMRARPREVAETRAVMPTMPYQTVDANSMGLRRGPNELYSNIGLDRAQPDVLSGLKSNPYAIQRVF
jgi:hypothetical protein